MLQGLVGDRVAQAAMHRLHGLPLAVVEEPFDVLTGRVALDAASETVVERVGERAEASQHSAGVPLVHTRNRKKSQASVQVRSFGFSCTKRWI